ncbi:hypothetical protein COBT_003256 [Conglomerata obtusa]
MSSKINEIELSSDSDDFNHPNIDKKSFMAFKREQKEQKKEEKRKMLKDIEAILEKKKNNAKQEHCAKDRLENNKTVFEDAKNQVVIENTRTSDESKPFEPNIIQTDISNNLKTMSEEDLLLAKAELELSLKEIIVETESNTVINNNIKESDEDKHLSIIMHLLNNNNIEEFMYILDVNTINIELLQDLVLYNLSGQIKEGNDEIGIEFTKLSIFIKYAIESGKTFMCKMKAALEDEKKYALFNEEVRLQYEESKVAILNLQNNIE